MHVSIQADSGPNPATDLSATVGFYAGLNLIAWGMIFCFVRETKQLTLEELDRKSNYISLIVPLC